jgi:hypothetical protein
MRIEQKHPELTWKRVWRNLHTRGLADTVTSEWYAAILDIIPTRQHLAAINLAPNTTCVICGEIDTLIHRISICNEGPVIWNWTKVRTAAILRVSPFTIPEEWALRPSYNLWPSQKHNAITCILAKLVYYRLQAQRIRYLKDYTN